MSVEAKLFCSSQFETKQRNNLFLLVAVLSTPIALIAINLLMNFVMFSELHLSCSFKIIMPHTKLMVFPPIFIVDFTFLALIVLFFKASLFFILAALDLHCLACGLHCPVACKILGPQPGISPMPPVLEGGFLTKETPGKSLLLFS